jgi:aerotaxis receptor
MIKLTDFRQGAIAVDQKEFKLDKDTMITSETDASGRICYANADFCAFAEYEKSELIGKPHNIVRHPEMPKAVFKTMWDTIQTGGTWNGIVKNRTKTGKYYWVNATIFPCYKHGKRRYISVRKKPTGQEVKYAANLYKQMREKE